MTRRYPMLVTAALLTVALGCVAFLLPVPYVTMKPGPTVNTLGKHDGKSVISFGKDVRTYDTTGSLSLTTVSVTRADSGLNLAEAFAAYFDPDDAVIPRDLVYPEGQSAQEAGELNELQMVGSKRSSEAAALRLAEYEVEETVVAVDVDGNGPAAGRIQPGDELLAVDGEPVDTPKDAVDSISGAAPGSTVDLRIVRDGSQRTVTIKTGPSPDDADKARIGVTLSSEFEFPFKIKNTIGESIGGPSAGTVFALAIYDKLTPGALTGGDAIAGTGAITDEGDVLPIGGIQQKIAGAAAAGAHTFLVPSRNCAEARAGDDFDLELLKVKDLEQAVSSLKAISDDPDAKVPRCN